MATVYRNLQEQVYENAKDMEQLNTEKIPNLENKTQNLTSNGVKTTVNANFEVTGTIMLHEGLWKASTNTYAYLPDKTGTLALAEDIPVNNGILKIGNTEITEAQLQQLLQLIQNQ